ncbi:MAG: hypothetical protein DRN16_00835 [Thermoplasmata archaeon]|nr:MAG: hypothetical protein DRM98_01450 [Thermoplasmata archaeon]RLF62694.1 MAG: hypothetical protein DRN16_00835 [Thermoplasmata archaeon]
MQYKHIQVNSLLNKIQTNDILFSGNYTLDPYKNCEFECLYCDSSFEKTIYIKQNAPEILEKELEKVEKGKIIVGSVHDPYQKVEKQTGLTRKLLKIIVKHGFDCHILTKSDLILRDIDVLSNIKNCKVTVSLISLNQNISQVFEKNIPSSEIRMTLVEKLNKHTIETGVALIPMLPFIVEKELEEIIKQAKKHKACYFLSKPLELKGDLKNIFINILKKYYPNHVKRYIELYRDSYKPDEEYVKNINNKIMFFCKKYKIKNQV